MAIGGILGGLANLGTIYGGYQRGQDLELLNQQRLQALQAQQMSWPDVLSIDPNKLMGGATAQPFQPSPTAGVPTAPSAPTSLTPPAYQAPPSTGPAPAPLPQSPQLQASAGPLGLSGIPGGGPLGMQGLPPMSGFGGGTPQLAGADAIFGPSTSAFTSGTPTSVPGQEQARGLPRLPFDVGQTEGGGLGPGTGVSDVYTGAMSFEPAPNLNGLGKRAQPAPSSGILQPPGSFGLPPGYAPTPPRAAAAPGATGTAGPDFDQPASGQAPQQTAQAPASGINVPAAAPTQLAAVQNAVFGIESNYGRDPDSVRPNKAGAVGPMQVTPKDYPQYDAQRLVNDPAYNKAAGDEIIAGLYKKYNGNPYLVAIGYNAGEGKADAVRDGRMSVNQLPAETQKYIANMQRRLGQSGDAITNAVLTSRQIVNASTSPQEKQAISVGNMAIVQRYPFLGQLTGTMDIHYLANLIEQNHPGASAAVKMGIFTNMFNLLQPMAKERFAETMALVTADIAEQQKEATEKETQWYHRALLGKQEGEPLGGPVQTPDGNWVQPMRSGPPLPLPGTPATAATAAARPENEPLGGPVQTPDGQWVQPMRKGPPQPLPGTPATAANLQARTEADPRKAAFEAYKTEYAAAHGGKLPSADDQAAYMRKLYPSRSAPGMALNSFIEQFQQENGRPPNSDEIRQFQAEGAAMTSEARTVGTAGANVDIQANKAEALIPLVKEKSAAISRTNYPDINSLILAYETKTGDPTVVQYGELVNSLRYTYAGVMARGGQPRVADIQHFDEIFNKAWSTGQVDAALDQMQITIDRERAAILKTRGQVGKPTGQREGAAAPSGAPAIRSAKDIGDITKMSAEEIQQLMQLPDEVLAEMTELQRTQLQRRWEEVQSVKPK